MADVTQESEAPPPTYPLTLPNNGEYEVRSAEKVNQRLRFTDRPELGHLARWHVSSHKYGFGIDNLRDNDENTFWQYVHSPLTVHCPSLHSYSHNNNRYSTVNHPISRWSLTDSMTLDQRVHNPMSSISHSQNESQYLSVSARPLLLTGMRTCDDD